MRSVTLLVSLLTVLTAGCVASVNPLADDDDDVLIVDNELIGTWMNDYRIEEKPASWMKVSLSRAGSKYDVETLSSEGRKAWSAKVVQLGDVRILDLVQVPPLDVEPLGLHQFFLLNRAEDTLTLRPIDGKRFREVVTASEPALAIGDDGKLDWSTEELQAFFKRHSSSVFTSWTRSSFKRFRAEK